MQENFYYLSSHKTSFVDVLQVVTFNNIPRKYLSDFCNICYFEEIFLEKLDDFLSEILHLPGLYVFLPLR